MVRQSRHTLGRQNTKAPKKKKSPIKREGQGKPTPPELKHPAGSHGMTKQCTCLAI
ncbi:hypothetical protein COCSUDRAFT_32825 [Coccomyxa subellipsoidea C-169]|uniref:Uncharacterized protein n=1 Tax=Coccomyxa subellipsoidea (strain C-169) TaxID=574566 RepID=I0Z2D2_COCSC|nr:hypothetical protein COCSUDRAFT_32825 [Coccomyxa subellipsoidea C-169]EIE24801.1 hypothetical protein COCSUDRAFT_32825 [Coccomyxa subellipsoidea C-169]|eukprot:XP_005649345.1 hypothetical protein COCSUDRAFT_32825 [Coccomyxa subellipsoidea C-169]